MPRHVAAARLITILVFFCFVFLQSLSPPRNFKDNAAGVSQGR